jgi:hypothetical protein
MTDHFHNCYVIRNDNSSTAANAIERVVHEVSKMRRSPLRPFIKFRPFLLVLIGPLRSKRTMG